MTPGGISGAGRYLSKTDDDGLAFQVVAEHLVAHLAAPARLLVAAERQGCVVDVVGVNPDRAGADHLGGFDGFRDVLRPDARSKAIVRVVGSGRDLPRVIEWHRRKHGAEYL